MRQFLKGTRFSYFIKIPLGIGIYLSNTKTNVIFIDTKAAKMLCELAVGLSCVLLLPVLAVAAFFLLKSRMRPRDDMAGALHRPEWERDVVYLVQFPTAPHCRTISPFALKLETWLRASKVKYEPVYSLKFSTATGQIPYIELNGEEMAGTYYCVGQKNPAVCIRKWGFDLLWSAPSSPDQILLVLLNYRVRCLD